MTSRESSLQIRVAYLCRRGIFFTTKSCSTLQTRNLLHKLELPTSEDGESSPQSWIHEVLFWKGDRKLAISYTFHIMQVNCDKMHNNLPKM